METDKLNVIINPPTDPRYLSDEKRQPHHHILVVQNGRKGSFRVALDGKPLKGVVSVRKTMRADEPMPVVEIQFLGDIEMYGALSEAERERTEARWREVTGEE